MLNCSAALQILAGGVTVITILAAIFTWLAYSDAKKGMVNVKHLRRISGTTYAQYILGNVGGVLFIACGIIMAVGINMADGAPLLTLQEALNTFSEIAITAEAVYLSVLIIGIVFIVFGIAWLIINLLSMKKIHRFVKSVYLGVTNGNTDFKLRSVKGWLITYAVFSVIAMSTFAIENLLQSAAMGCTAAVFILSAILVDKYFTKEQ